MNSGFPRSAVVSNAQHPQFHSLPHHMQAQRPPVFRRPPWENSNPFVLLPIYSRKKKCAGCPFEFRDPKGPPYLGLVLQHKEKDIYFRDGIQHISGEQNRYYHCNVNCLNSRHPYFTPSLVQIPVGMQLSNEQKTLIDQGIGLKLQLRGNASFAKTQGRKVFFYRRNLRVPTHLGFHRCVLFQSIYKVFVIG